MRLTTVFIIASLMQVSAATFGQQITLNKQNASLMQILKEIRTQSGYDIVTEGNTMLNKQKVSVNLTNASIDEAIKSTLSGLDLTYVINNKIITIKKKEEPSFLDRVKDYFAAFDVRGRVVDSQGLGIPGATVKVKEGNKGTTTDAKGAFTLKGVEQGAVLMISFIGYLNKELSAGQDLGEIKLELSTSKLDEVRVIAYGKASDRTSVGNISSVSAKEIAQQPVNNVLLAMIGRVPGLNITQQGGWAGQAVKVQIQGQNSINKGNDPLYVIDNIPFQSSDFPIGAGGMFGLSPLSLINPNDIESISVLKDADATSIYGSRAANGAILITTKKGHFGSLRVDVRAQQGFGQVSGKIAMMNTEEYLTARRDALARDGLTPSSNPADPGYAPELTLFDQEKYTDWQKVLLGNYAHYTDINPSISGGTELTQYRFGLTYHRETSVTVIKNPTQKGGIQFSLNTTSSNQKLKAGLQSNLLIDNSKLPNIDLVEYSLRLAPNSPDLYNSDGSLNKALNADGSTNWIVEGINPLARADSYSLFKNFNVSVSGTLSYQLAKGLNLSSSFGFNKVFADRTNITKATSISAYEFFLTRSASFGVNRNQSMSAEPQLSYKSVFGKGNLDVLMGSSIQHLTSKGWDFSALGQPSDEVLSSVSAATTLFPGSTVDNNYRYNAGFGRITYNWDNKYVVNANLRRDGSSRFGIENQFNTFWSTGAAWILSEESWFKTALPWVDFAKINASYGTTGNDQITDYSFLSLYSPNANISRPYQGIASFYPTNLSNPYLQWEETRKLNMGLNLSLFNERLSVMGNYFRNRSSNQLLDYILPITTGFSSLPYNRNATVQNTGTELTVGTKIFKSKNFGWTTSFNVTVPRNKLLKYDDIENSSEARTLILGKPISLLRLYHFAEVNKMNGKYYFTDRDGNLTTQPEPDDMTVILDNAPKYYGGLNNNIRLGDLTLDFTFSFRKQVSRNYSHGFNYTSGWIYSGNMPSALNNRWRQPGDVSATGVLSATNNEDWAGRLTAFDSDAVFSEVFFARLTNASVSWQLPSALQSKLKVANSSVFVNGQNLFLLSSKYVGIDPETQSLGLPMLRMITFGLNITF